MRSFGFFILGLTIALCASPILHRLYSASEALEDTSVQFLRKRLVANPQAGIFDRELKRVRGYESQLKERSADLDLLIESVREIEKKIGKKQVPLVQESKLEIEAKNGLGGGSENIAPIVSSPEDAKSATLKKKAERISSKDSVTKAGAKLLQTLEKQGRKLQSIPLGLPVSARISSGFGHRRSPFSRHRYRMHSGVDIAAKYGTSVESTASGMVKKAGYIGAYGRSVVIDHGRGYETLYGHLSRIKVKVGQKIERGAIIGNIGSSGRSTGPHLHYEVRVDGKPINPDSYMKLATWLKLI